MRLSEDEIKTVLNALLALEGANYPYLFEARATLKEKLQRTLLTLSKKPEKKAVKPRQYGLKGMGK